MNGQLAKEERRNLRKAMGETATDALERARNEVLKLRMEHAAIAKELADYKVQADAFATLMRSENLSLNGRIDGTAAWCEQNEGAVKATASAMDKRAVWQANANEAMDARLLVFERLSFVQRWRWVLFGTLPPPPDRAWTGSDVLRTEWRPLTWPEGKVRVAPRQVVIE